VNCGDVEDPVSGRKSGQRPGPRPAQPPAADRGDPSPGEAGTAEPPGRPGPEHVVKVPDHGDALRIAAFLESHPQWSAFWDKREGVWRVAEDDPYSELYAESVDADRVIDYMATQTQRAV
jgi:hypothetical protein